MSSKRVLSIQSHVVYGYVGNKAATFPLQLLGFDVDCINTVQYSNHTGYKIVRGFKTTPDDIDSVFDGLFENSLYSQYNFILSGYVSEAETLKRIAQNIRKMKHTNSSIFYALDPVLGDDGTLYVPQDLVSVYRAELLTLADLITPNSTEFQFLSGHKATSIEELKKGMDFFHSKGIRFVVVSSCHLNNDKKIEVVASDSKEWPQIYKIEVPLLRGDFSGTGDLFSSLMLGNMDKFKIHETPFIAALENSVASLQEVIKNTIKLNEKEKRDHFNNELRLIQSADSIKSPSIKHKVQKI